MHVYLINHDSAESLTTPRTISPPVNVSLVLIIALGVLTTSLKKLNTERDRQ